MTIYIAGPMSGKKDFNYPAFNDAARTLRANGHTVYNPAEIVPPTPAYAKFLGKKGVWAWYMKKAISMLLKTETIVLLPGWEDSTGAKLELQIAASLGYDVKHFEEMELIL